MSAATKDALNTLHAKLAEKMADILEHGEVVKNADGEPVKLTPTAATLSCVRQFLKDNNIEAATGPITRVANAAAGLPFPAEQHPELGDDHPVKH